MSEISGVPGDGWLVCPACTRTNLNQMGGCSELPCGLGRRRLRLNTHPRVALAGSGLAGVGLLLSAGPLLLLLLPESIHWLLLVPLLLCLGVGALLGLLFWGMGLFLLFGSQIELMQPNRQRAALTVNLAGRMMGGVFYHDIQRLTPDLPLWPEELVSLSLALVAVETDAAVELVEAALLGLLARGLIELWTARTDTWLGRWPLRQQRQDFYLRPALMPGEAPPGGLEARLLKLLQSWERNSRLGRGPLGLTLTDLLDAHFESQKLARPEQVLCEQLRRESPWLTLTTGGRFVARAERLSERDRLLFVYHDSLRFWQRAEPELSAELRAGIGAALKARKA